MTQGACPRIGLVRALGPIILIGMPGAGKSSIGRRLAGHIDTRFTDLDVEVERRVGSSIATFFAAHGETAFRDLEADLLAEMSESTGGVIATGGGAVLRESNRNVLRRWGTVVYLRADPAELYRRVRHETARPLLQVADPLATLNRLRIERDPLYSATAHLVVATGNQTVDALARGLAAAIDRGCASKVGAPDAQGS